MNCKQPKNNDCNGAYCDDVVSMWDECVPKTTISDLEEIRGIDLDLILSSACDKITIPVNHEACDDKSTTHKLDILTLLSRVSNLPLGFCMWSPFDLGDIHEGWAKLNGQTLSSKDYKQFFSQVVSGFFGSEISTFTLPDMKDKFASGAGEETGKGIDSSNKEAETSGSFGVKLKKENLPNFNIEINDPGHRHNFDLPIDRDNTNGTNTVSIEEDTGKLGFEYSFSTENGHTGISANPRVGVDGTGEAKELSIKNPNVAGYWYMKVKNNV